MALPLRPLRAALSPISSVNPVIPHSRAASTSILFALPSLSNSRETAHLNKLSRLPRTEHSPPLKLIEESEIKAHPLPTPPNPPKNRWIQEGNGERGRRRIQTAAYDARATQVGKAVLASHAKQTAALQRALIKSEYRAARQQGSFYQDREKFAREAQKLRNEVRVAGVWILVTIGVATGLGMWKFWPERSRSVGEVGAVDSGVLGKEIARRASEGRVSASLGAKTVAVGDGMAGPEAAGPAVRAVEVAKEVPAASVAVANAGGRAESERSWWEGWFWKQP